MERWKAQEMVLCNSDCNDMAYYICAYIKNYFIKNNVQLPYKGLEYSKQAKISITVIDRNEWLFREGKNNLNGKHFFEMFRS